MQAPDLSELAYVQLPATFAADDNACTIKLRQMQPVSDRQPVSTGFIAVRLEHIAYMYHTLVREAKLDPSVSCIFLDVSLWYSENPEYALTGKVTIASKDEQPLLPEHTRRDQKSIWY